MSNVNSVARTSSLVALVVQQVALVLLIRYSRTRQQSSGATASYLISTAVVSAEVGKLLLNLFLEVVSTTCFAEGQKFTFKKLWNGICARDSWRLVVPAFLYVVQNNLLFVALENLSVPVYQVTNQGKLLTTAICSRWLLQKKISTMQYVSLLLLAAGVAVVQLSSLPSKQAGGSSTATVNDEAAAANRNQFIGLAAVIASCFTSGFAGVYFEKVLKGSSDKTSPDYSSVYVRNVQLSAFSIILALFPVLTTDYTKIVENGFFANYDIAVWIVVICQTLTGLLVALVMKYADSILKGFCTSVAVVAATLLSIWLFETHVDKFFFVGATFVVGAVQLYSKYPPQASAEAASPKSAGKASESKSRCCPTTFPSSKVLLFFVVLLVLVFTMIASSPMLGAITAQMKSADMSTTQQKTITAIKKDQQPPLGGGRRTTMEPALEGSTTKQKPTKFTVEQLLKFAVSIMNDYEIPNVIMFNTLLGKVRSESLTPEANDIDFMVPAEYGVKLVEALRNGTDRIQDGTELFIKDFVDRGIIQVTNDPVSGQGDPSKPEPGYFVMDVFLFKEKEDIIVVEWTKTNFKKQHLLPVQASSIRLDETDESMIVNVPNRWVPIIEELYGEDWKTSMENFPFCGAGKLGSKWVDCFPEASPDGKRTKEAPPKLTMEQLLKFVMTVMNENEIPSVIMYGTLLGQVRTGTLIPHECDIDFILSSEYGAKLVAALRNSTSRIQDGTELFIKDHADKGIIQVTNDPVRGRGNPSKSRPGYVLMDLYLFDEGEGIIRVHWDQIKLRKEQIFPVQRGSIHLVETNENITVNVPNQGGSIIEALYGKDWNIPVTDDRGKKRKSPYCGAGKKFGQYWVDCFPTLANNTQKTLETTSKPSKLETDDGKTTKEAPPKLTMEQLLKFVLSVMDENELPSVIMYGTLLGQVRTGTLIPHECDIDFILSAEYGAKLVAALRNSTSRIQDGTELFIKDHADKGIIQVTNDPVRGRGNPGKPRPGYVLMDVYIFNEDEGIIRVHWDQIKLRKEQVFPVQRGSIHLVETNENVTVNVPNQGTSIIEALYGKDWNIPVTDDRGKNRTSPYCGAGKKFRHVWVDCFPTLANNTQKTLETKTKLRG